MVAMIITLVGLLGLLVSVNIASQQNLKNATRNEAMMIAEDYMNQLRVTSFSNISSRAWPDVYTYGAKQAQSKLRGVSTQYTVLRTGSAITDTAVLITVNVQWTYKNALTSQGLQTVRSNAQ